MRSLWNNTEGDVIPLLLYFLTIIGVGGLYSLLFLEIGYPAFLSYIPESDAKVVIMMCLYAIPLFVILVGLLSMLKTGLKHSFYKGGM